ncbi:MAG TPA: ATP-binding protein [Cyclobacteriaceae bacterium]
MEMVILIGIPASGKSSFYKMNFFNTHMRVSLDLFNTRNKEQRFMELAFSLQQRMVLDNTNVTRESRLIVISKAKAFKYKVKGYYFESRLNACLERNELRSGKDKVDPIGIRSKHKDLELPLFSEGFDELFYVTMVNDEFKVNEWKDEI